MDPTVILVAIAALAAIGCVAAAVLAVASRVFHVDEDPRIAELLAVLPGANCGVCGSAGCAGFAADLVAGKADPASCAPGGAEVAALVGSVLGMQVAARERLVARLLCRGGDAQSRRIVDYRGLTSCKAVCMVSQAGTKACPFACEGFGDCVGTCPFDALKIGPDGLPVIDEERCTGCGKCAAACPKNVLHMERVGDRLYLACQTDLPPRAVRKACSVGCIGCRRCVRACPYEALKWDGRAPHVDTDLCRECGLCVDACRQAALVFAGSGEPDPQARAEAEIRAAELDAERAAARQAAATAAEG